MLRLEHFSFGVGDRFGHEASAQLKSFQILAERGIQVTPVWNKSNREHTFIGSEPDSVRAAAQIAVQELGWKGGWHVDADHIRLETVDRFLASSDFFTIDVADSIGKAASAAMIDGFVSRHPELLGQVSIKGIDEPFKTSLADLESLARKYLLAVSDAGKIYRHIAEKKGGDDKFIAEVSMDETDSPQTPPELLMILAALADEGVKVQTIAPKFTGRFNKGVDYVGDLKQFEKEFSQDLAVIAYAVEKYDLPKNLKLSVHSGSDKFSLYSVIRKALKATGAGIHVKTAGTTWLEECIGLAEAGGDGLSLVKEFYAYAFDHSDELCAPYASVIDIDRNKLPSPVDFRIWDGTEVAESIRHVPGNPRFNANIRQLLHVSFKLAAKAGTRYTGLLKQHREIVAKNVTENIYERHLKPLFIG
jgi:hypothetical protein